MELYHNREGMEVLEQEMAEAYNARSAELKALDKAAACRSLQVSMTKVVLHIKLLLTMLIRPNIAKNH